jgi:hypothetical protein
MTVPHAVGGASEVSIGRNAHYHNKHRQGEQHTVRSMHAVRHRRHPFPAGALEQRDWGCTDRTVGVTDCALYGIDSDR